MKKGKNKKVSDKTLIVAGDVSKGKISVIWRCPDGTESKPFEVFNNGRGFGELFKAITHARQTYNLEEIIYGQESTGSYGEPLNHYLIKKKVRVVQVNPMHTKRLKELQGNSPNKTDQKDPKVIADIIELGHYLTVVVPEGAAAELDELNHIRQRCVEEQKGLWNKLQDQVFKIFPEFSQEIKDIKTKTAKFLLEHYPRPRDIIELGLEDLAIIMKKVSRGRWDMDKAAALFKAAWQSAGIRQGQASIVFDIKRLLSAIEDCERVICEIEEKMSAYLKQIPYSRFILSIQGIGTVIAAGLIGEVGDFTKFKTTAELTKLAGLDLFEISSGQHMGKRRISKRGRSLLRKVLYFGAINVVRKGRILHEKYQAYLKREMPKMKALTAIARKLLGIIFALVRKGNEFDIDYQNKSLNKVCVNF